MRLTWQEITDGCRYERDPETDDSAFYDVDGEYRYLLIRNLKPNGNYQNNTPRRKRLNFIMLNPSTATAFKNDPTITRCVGYAERFGAEELWVTNLFALRSRDPKALLKHPHPYGPRNIDFLRFARNKCGLVICGWGGEKAVEQYKAFNQLSEDWSNLYCLGRTRFNAPRHPLYLAKAAPLEKWPKQGIISEKRARL